MRVDIDNFPTDHNGRGTTFLHQHVHLMNTDPRTGQHFPDTPLERLAHMGDDSVPFLPRPPHQSGPSPHEPLEQDEAGHLDRSYP